MGSDLAAAHNTLYSIEEEEAHIKATFKERKASVEQTIGKLSRELGSGFTMQNVECKWIYDLPNVGEVSYARIDTGEVVKTRAMTAQERQQELPLEPVAVNPQKPEETVEAIYEFIQNNGGPGAIEKVTEALAEVYAKDVVHVETMPDVVGEPYGESIAIEPAQPEAARQTLLTMGDAKKGRKKKAVAAEETVPDPPKYLTTEDDLDFQF